MMKVLKLSAGLVLGVSTAASVAMAAAPSRIWVSGHGTDAAGCSTPANPCRTLQYAHDTIAAGGEIDILDPAGYGSLIITKAVSIVNDGVGTAGVQAASGTAITINAGAHDAVELRGLAIDGLGTATTGIAWNGGLKLAIEQCTVRHFLIGVELTSTTSQGTVEHEAHIQRSIIDDNAVFGITANPPSGAYLLVTIGHSDVSGNHNYGIDAVSGGTLSMNVADVSLFLNGSFGVSASGAGTTVTIGSSSSDSAMRIYQGATINSYGDNDQPSTPGVTSISRN